MDRLVVNVIDDAFFGECEFLLEGKSTNVVGFRRSAWKLLRKVEPEYGFFSRANRAIEFKCGKCKSFSISCRNLFFALEPNPGIILEYEFIPASLTETAGEALHVSAWSLLHFLVEESPFTEDEERRWLNEVLPEKRLVFQKNGDLVFREGGYPLGLKFDEVFWCINPDCESCSGMFIT